MLQKKEREKFEYSWQDNKMQFTKQYLVFTVPVWTQSENLCFDYPLNN